MKHLAPACFRAFVCAGGSCLDSCCRAGWEIIPDAETLKLYETLPGPAGERVRAGIAFNRSGAQCAPQHDEPLLRQNDSRVCVLLDPDGLCCVQKAFGHGALCKVCRDYPRYRRDFGGLTEHGVSLSCLTAYALAVSTPPIWEEWEDDAPPVPNELDPESYLRLRRGRELALALLAREDLPLWRRTALVRRLAAALQGAPERLVKHDYALRLGRWIRVSESEHRKTKNEKLRSFANRDLRYSSNSQLSCLARRFLSLEILSPAWKDALERFIALGEQGGLPDDLPAPEAPEPYARWLWYSLCKYWLDALDDGNLLGRVDRSLDMLWLGLAMDRALPGEGPFLRRISREIEHCEENLAALL